MFGRRKAVQAIAYDPETEWPAVKTSICTGERVVGFQNKTSRQFRDYQMIRTDAELLTFCRACGIQQSELKSIV